MDPEVAAYVAPLRDIPDALERFARAGVLAEHHRAVAAALYRLRELAALELSEGGSSYAAIAKATGLSRARIQRLVEHGRELRGAWKPV